MKTRSVLALAVGYPLLGGCVQGPPLQYTAFSDGGGPLQGDYAGLTKFTLARSLILVRSSKGEPASVTSVPAEATGEGTDFGVRSLRGASDSALQLTKIGNSNLVQSLALQAAPNSVSPLAPGAALVPQAAAHVQGHLAVAIDVQALLQAAIPGATTVAGVAPGEGGELAFSVAFAPVPADAIPTRSLDLQRTGSLYFYSACRTATLTVLNAPLARQAYTVTVADPHFVQTVAVGAGRVIASHSSCGVDVLAGAGAAPDAGAMQALGQWVEQARGLNARWATRPMADTSAALAALGPVARPKPARRKSKPVIAASPTPPPRTTAVPTPAADGPLRNAEIRAPNPRAGQSFAF